MSSNPPLERDRREAALLGSLRGFAAPAAPQLARYMSVNTFMLRFATTVLLSAAAFLPLSSIACSPPVVNGRPVHVAPLSYVAQKAFGIAQIEFEQNLSPSAPLAEARWRVRVHRWLKQAGPNEITISGFSVGCPILTSESPFKPGGRLVVFLSPPSSPAEYKLIENGGDVDHWIFSNALGDGQEAVKEILKVSTP